MRLSSPATARPDKTCDGAPTGLFASLLKVPDPRRGGGRRHPREYVLAVLTMAFACAGFASYTGVAQWAAAASPKLLVALGARPDPFDGTIYPPSEATLRRMASRVDQQALEAVLATWTARQLD